MRRGRQDARDQVVQLHLAEGAAGLLVIEEVLQADDLAGEAGDVTLGLVDHFQVLGQLAELFRRLRRRRLQPVAEPFSHGVEPIVQRAGQLRPVRRRLLGQLAEPAGKLALGAQQGLRGLPHPLQLRVAARRATPRKQPGEAATDGAHRCQDQPDRDLHGIPHDFESRFQASSLSDLSRVPI